ITSSIGRGRKRSARSPHQQGKHEQPAHPAGNTAAARHQWVIRLGRSADSVVAGVFCNRATAFAWPALPSFETEMYAPAGVLSTCRYMASEPAVPSHVVAASTGRRSSLSLAGSAVEKVSKPCAAVGST